jgi:hypothetical protein
MKQRTHSRSDLRLADLKKRHPGGDRLMNVKLPAQLADAIAELADALNASKTDVIVALLNEGLSAAGRLQKRS